MRGTEKESFKLSLRVRLSDSTAAAAAAAAASVEKDEFSTTDSSQMSLLEDSCCHFLHAKEDLSSIETGKSD